MRSSNEDLDQIAIFDWIRKNPYIEPFCFHIANERKCSPQQGAKLKSMGVKAGVSDIFVAIPKNGYHGLFIELKHGKNKPNANQLIFLDNMNQQGYLAKLSYGIVETIDLIKNYLK